MSKYDAYHFQADPVRIEHRIHLHHEQEQSYPEVSFEVPAGVEKIEISYQYVKNERTVIDIGLRSPERIIGWSGGGREVFFVGLEKATPGYLPGSIGPGAWAVMLGAYRVPEDGCAVDLQIVLTFKHPRWLKGDLHAHSVHSDGSYTLNEAMALCKKAGLDFLALTDHNNASQNRYVHIHDEELLLIPGVEMTSYKGHANLLGQPDALDDFRVLTPQAAAEELGKAREKGALVSLNHPFSEGCPWELGFDVPFDALEVWNGPWSEENEKAVRWWHERLAEGRRIAAVGGSDTHRNDPYVRHGSPTTHVFAESETAQAVIAAVRQGAVVLTMRPDAAFVTLTAGQTGIGGEADTTGLARIELNVSVCGTSGDRISLWSDRGVEREWTADGDMQIACDMPVDRLFYRVEAHRYLAEWDREVMTCLTNPVYLARRHEASGE